MTSPVTGGVSLGYQGLNKALNNQNQSFNRLSSGQRINSARDDAAGLAISNRFNAQMRGFNQAINNANDGVSLTQTADGALGETTSILQRMRELSVQSSNAIYNDADRKSMNAEFGQLQSELDRIAGQTSFNGVNMLDGSLAETGMNFQVGAEAHQTIEVNIGGATQDDLGTTSLDILSSEGAQASLSAIDEALTRVADVRGELGAVQNRFESAITNLGNAGENIAAANSRIADADVAAEASNLTRDRILQQSSIAMQAQANQSAQTVLRLLG